jgi:hypothetical protein
MKGQPTTAAITAVYAAHCEKDKQSSTESGRGSGTRLYVATASDLAESIRTWDVVCH